jgi:hypothetical protein
MGTLQSLTGGVLTFITFTNQTSHEAYIHWLDFDGQRQYYKGLPPGESYRQETFVGHPWEILNARTNRYFLPTTSGEHHVTITPVTASGTEPVTEEATIVRIFLALLDDIFIQADSPIYRFCLP